ncbi:hypothetical protein B566_EDAN018177 [Ephemera danica]|nr:hypothetical protein B566_EDAN018177 [Ephemera danica]
MTIPTLLVVADPLESFKTYKDTSFAMMREAARRGWQLFACEPAQIHWLRGGAVSAQVREIALTGDEHAWFTVKRVGHHALREFTAAGKARLGARVQVAYFDQMRGALDLNATLADTISPGSEWVEIGTNRKHVKSYLGDFLFSPARSDSPVRTLSGGERNRLLLARLFALPANVLVLDEPTNDLDIDTLELLEELLQNYPGTVLLVSHDRRFLDNVVTSYRAVHRRAGQRGALAGPLCADRRRTAGGTGALGSAGRARLKSEGRANVKAGRSARLAGAAPAVVRGRRMRAADHQAGLQIQGIEQARRAFSRHARPVGHFAQGIGVLLQPRGGIRQPAAHRQGRQVHARGHPVGGQATNFRQQFGPRPAQRQGP